MEAQEEAMGAALVDIGGYMRQRLDAGEGVAGHRYRADLLVWADRLVRLGQSGLPPERRLRDATRHEEN